MMNLVFCGDCGVLLGEAPLPGTVEPGWRCQNCNNDLVDPANRCLGQFSDEDGSRMLHPADDEAAT